MSAWAQREGEGRKRSHAVKVLLSKSFQSVQMLVHEQIKLTKRGDEVSSTSRAEKRGGGRKERTERPRAEEKERKLHWH